MFFDRLRRLCEDRGISIYKAATEIGLNRAAANKWKGGSIPNGQTLSKLADYFGVTVGYLLGDDSEPRFSESESRKTADILDEVDVAFYGDYKELSEDDKETLRAMARVMKERQAKRNQEKK